MVNSLCLLGVRVLVGLSFFFDIIMVFYYFNWSVIALQFCDGFC